MKENVAGRDTNFPQLPVEAVRVKCQRPRAAGSVCYGRLSRPFGGADAASQGGRLDAGAFRSADHSLENGAGPSSRRLIKRFLSRPDQLVVGISQKRGLLEIC
jgi:hypothetical protein